MENLPLDDHLLVPQAEIYSQLNKLGLSQNTEVLWAGQPSKGTTLISLGRFMIAWFALIVLLFTLNFLDASKNLMGMTFLGAFLASIIFLVLLIISAIGEQLEIKKIKDSNFLYTYPKCFLSHI